MEDSEPYSSVTVGAIVIKPKQQFNPTYLSVSVSDDGSTYIEVARDEYATEGQFEPNGLKEYKVTFPETTARYIKVSVGCLPAVPQWHHYFGRPGCLSVDEIIVE
jgi:hexosaminidase